MSIVKDAPDLSSARVEQTMLPPEMSGMTTIIRTLLPLIVSVIGSVGIVIVRAAHTAGTSTVGAAIRVTIGLLLLTALTALWVQRRDQWRESFKNMMAEGREVTAQKSAQRAQGSRP